MNTGNCIYSCASSKSKLKSKITAKCSMRSNSAFKKMTSLSLLRIQFLGLNKKLKNVQLKIGISIRY